MTNASFFSGEGTEIGSCRTMRRQVLLFLSALCLKYVLGQVSYSIPEEMAKGSVVGNIAHDLGLDLKRLKSGNARVYTGGGVEYIGLNKERGVLLVEQRIDREALCGETTPCALHFQLILENPMELFRVTVEITDINDNTPTFTNSEKRFEISESAVIGSKFVLEKAVDSDIGMNGLQQYSLAPSDHFVLKLESQPDGTKKVEMVLQKPLDREKKDYLSLLLTAMDGGEPQMSGTMQIFVTVLDVNDNAPTFAKPLYRAKLQENSPKGTSVTTVSASDKDIGSNGELSYLISTSKRVLSELFNINPKTGEIILVGEIDYEKANSYQIDIEVVDSGGLSDSAKVIVDLIDVNDNSPQINMVSKSESISENSPTNTVIAMLSINDPDSENNGNVVCDINDSIPFKIQTTVNGFYTLVMEVALDREMASQYNITVTCSDEGLGQPSRSATVVVNVAVADSFPEVLSEFTELTHDKEYNDNLTFYLVLALAVVSFLFITCLVVIISVKIYRWRQSRILYHSNLPVIPYYPPRYSDTLGTGTLPHVYNYEVCRTTDSRKSDCKFGRAGSQNVLIMDPSSTGTMQRIQSEKSILDEPDSPLEVSYIMILPILKRKLFFLFIVFTKNQLALVKNQHHGQRHVTCSIAFDNGCLS
ncbi:protocadherin beta-16-like [Haplochromis burtoni]|uniref:protocadherin beta-16-like n=1 Tax=Haplochromis burtoni TaxID=8153 RepID=UPI001C2DB746|nr:protocadherin beta-16-like [Haplochromis burtoni]